MHILIRLPNWLGDMIMSIALVKEVQIQYPDARISVIAKKGLHPLLEFFPPLHRHYVFSKSEYKGLGGAWKFGKMIRREIKPDLFICLPDSFSSAFMAFATGAKQRIGYKKELRSMLMTHTYARKPSRHRVEDYLNLFVQFTGKPYDAPQVTLEPPPVLPGDFIIVNVNSEAESRRLPLPKAISLINTLRKATDRPIKLIGGPSDKNFVDQVMAGLESDRNISNLAGATSLQVLVGMMQQAAAVLSTDSGPAHVANSVETPLVVLFGAGNEHNTGPWNKQKATVIRLGKLPCEPCVNNVCKVYGTPKCLEDLSDQLIVDTLLSKM